MEIIPELKPQHSTELSIEKRQEKERFLFTGKLKHHPGQRIWRFNLYDRELGECRFFEKSDTIHWEDIVSGKWLQRERDILIEEGFDYVVKLNYDNAKKYFQDKYPGEPIEKEGYKANKLFKKQRTVNTFVNKD